MCDIDCMCLGMRDMREQLARDQIHSDSPHTCVCNNRSYAHERDVVPPMRMAEGESMFPRYDANVNIREAVMDGSSPYADYLARREREAPPRSDSVCCFQHLASCVCIFLHNHCTSEIMAPGRTNDAHTHTHTHNTHRHTHTTHRTTHIPVHTHSTHIWMLWHPATTKLRYAWLFATGRWLAHGQRRLQLGSATQSTNRQFSLWT
jgi:hypothetical protein